MAARITLHSRNIRECQIRSQSNVIPFKIEGIARKLNGAAGVDSVDAAHAKVYLTGYRRALAELREVMVDWAEWLANTTPDWAAYRGITTRRLLALDKEPGTRLVGIGSIWL